MSEDIPNKYKKIAEELKPHYEKLVRESNRHQCFVTGFIYADLDNTSDPFLIRFGNIMAPTPADQFMVTYQLAAMAARLESSGNMTREMVFQDAPDESDSNSGPQGPSPLEIADKLALAVISSPSEGLHPEVEPLLAAYFAARRPVAPPPAPQPALPPPPPEPIEGEKNG